MTIMLIASAMRVNEINPEDMYKRLSNSLDPDLLKKIPINKEEISTKVREDIMYQHIINLFDMSKIIGTDYAFIMVNMAIVPYTGLEKNTFYNWALSSYYANNKDRKIDVNWLIERRWIQLDESTQFISLHPVISDVAKSVLEPDSQKCAEFVKNMIDFTRDNRRGKTHIEWTKSMNMLELACKRICDETKMTIDLFF